MNVDPCDGARRSSRPAAPIAADERLRAPGEGRIRAIQVGLDFHQTLSLIRRQASEGHARREAIAELLEGVRSAGPVLFRFRDEVDEVLEQRRRVLEVMDSLPPEEAVLLRADCAALFNEERPATAQLRRRHPLLLGTLAPNTIDQRRKRGRPKWAELVHKRSKHPSRPGGAKH